MPIAPQKPINTAAPSIFTVTAQDFQQNVLMGSMQRPVLAYFTAAWCGPCKQLRPVLEKAVMALGGKVGLAVIDIDANQDLAAAMRVQSVPQ
ncbi:MAG TPA: co-chaperone YbbN, partial [Rhodospirillaceae bacterium]|nr:co-chaperone YbbN [Rhodospirillaceae bacterium]